MVKSIVQAPRHGARRTPSASRTIEPLTDAERKRLGREWPHRTFANLTPGQREELKCQGMSDEELDRLLGEAAVVSIN